MCYVSLYCLAIFLCIRAILCICVNNAKTYERILYNLIMINRLHIFASYRIIINTYFFSKKQIMKRQIFVEISLVILYVNLTSRSPDNVSIIHNILQRNFRINYEDFVLLNLSSTRLMWHS